MLRKRFWRDDFVRLLTTLFLAAGTLATSPAFANGLDYLATQQQADGSFGGTPTALRLQILPRNFSVTPEHARTEGQFVHRLPKRMMQGGVQ